MQILYKSQQKIYLLILFVISLSFVNLCISPALASDHTKISFEPIFAPEPPTITNVYPPNQSTNIGIHITCRIQINDNNNDDLNVTWYSSKNGKSWTVEQINSSFHSGDTAYWTYIKAKNYLTKYWWKVDVDDGLFTTTEIYYFTTKKLLYPPYRPPNPPIIPVVNKPPVADIQKPNSGYETYVNETIYFSSDNSYDPDGTIVYYLWDFGDYNTSELPNPTHIYKQPGAYTVVLTVIDDDGLSDMDLIFIHIKPKPSEEPEERELPSTICTIIIGIIIVMILIILLFLKRKRDQRQKSYSNIDYPRSNDKFTKSLDNNIDKILNEKNQ